MGAILVCSAGLVWAGEPQPVLSTNHDRLEPAVAELINRTAERVEAEREELVVIQSFLPSLADLETTRGWVVEAIASTGASAKGDIGRVMGALMKVHKGEVDGGLAKGIASDLLGE